MKPLFVFGTLRDGDVREAVLGALAATLDVRAAWIDGVETVTLPGETYPVLAARAGARAHGAVLAGLAREHMERIAFFEGDEYAFEDGVATVGGRSPVAVVLCAERVGVAGSREPWSLAAWRTRHKPRFLEMTRAYMALYGTMTAAEADRVVWQAMRSGARTGA